MHKHSLMLYYYTSPYSVQIPPSLIGVSCKTSCLSPIDFAGIRNYLLHSTNNFTLSHDYKTSTTPIYIFFLSSSFYSAGYFRFLMYTHFLSPIDSAAANAVAQFLLFLRINSFFAFS